MTDDGRWRDIALAGHTGNTALARGAFTDDDPVARELALGALERLGVLTDADIATALTDADATVRRRAAMIAGRRPGVDLLGALDDADVTVAEAAAWACGEQEAVGEAVFARLLALASGAHDALVREAAVAALGAIGDERAVDVIVAACTDKPAVRRRAVLALAPFDGPQVDAALAAALEDRDWQVRQAAEDILRAINGD